MAHRATWEPFKAKNGRWHFRVKAGNGEIVSPSQGYASRRGAIRGFYSAQRAFASAVMAV